MIVKVCGMRDAHNITEVGKFAPDWMGLIFYSKSPRYVGNIDSKQVICSLESFPGMKRVGVFVNGDEAEIIRSVNDYSLDIVQLHGSESYKLCHTLKDKGLTVVKALQIEKRADLIYTKLYEAAADYFLFDTRCKSFGGSGKMFDWSVLDAYQGTVPFLLSGGISQDSVDLLKTFKHPCWQGVDLNSGFENAPALKDPLKINKFIQQFKKI